MGTQQGRLRCTTELSDDTLKLVFRELAMAAHRDSGEYKIPG
jgi:hypothetical protein